MLNGAASYRSYGQGLNTYRKQNTTAKPTAKPITTQSPVKMDGEDVSASSGVTSAFTSLLGSIVGGTYGTVASGINGESSSGSSNSSESSQSSSEPGGSSEGSDSSILNEDTSAAISADRPAL